ncbi:MAG: hypothetical protein IJD32_04675 [Bacteroidaceae bacterium]|nr:hypothetical protein [Bacteroidaceae bacterium]
MRKVLYLLLLFGLVSCSLSNDEVIIENNVSRPTAYEIKVDELLYVDRIGVYDSLLIVINRKVEPIFCVYDSRTFAFKGSFGKIGHGPGDFQFPFFLKDMKSEDDILELYDVGTASFKSVSLNSRFDELSNSVASEKMPSQLIGSPNLTKIGLNDFVGNMDNGKGLFFRYKGSHDEMKWVEFPATLQQPKLDFTVMNRNRIAIHPQKGKVLSAMTYYNLLFLYDENCMLKKTVQIGHKEIKPTVMGEFQLSEDNYICFREVVSTENKVYVLMQNIKEKNFEKNDNPPSRILVFDWNLKNLETYQLPHYATTFALDSLNERIIYTAFNEEGGTDLFYISLNE